MPPYIAFVPDPKADVILKSSDSHFFPIRRSSLQSCSDVFDGMFASLSDAEAEKGPTTGLPLVRLDDKGTDLDVFLRFVIRDQVPRGLDGSKISLEQTKT